MVSKKPLLLLNVFHILLDGFYDSIPVLLAIIVSAKANADSIVGSITSVAALGGTVAGLSSIFISSRYTLMQATLLILFTGCIGFFVVAFSGGIWMVGLGFTLVALGQNVFHNMAFSYFTQTTERASLGRVISDFTAIGDVGRIPLVSLASFIGAMNISEIAGWRLATFSFGLINLLLVLGFYPVAFSKAETSAVGSGAINRFFPSFGLVKNAKVLLMVLANMFNTISCGSLFSFLPLLLLSKGFSPTTLAGFAFGFTSGCFIGKIACGRLIDRFGSQAIFVGAQLLLSVLIFLLICSSNLYGVIVISLAIGVVTKGSVPVVQTLATEHVDRKLYDDIFSINSFFRGAALIVTPMLFGFLASTYGIEMIYLFMAGASVVAIIPIIAMRFVHP